MAPQGTRRRSRRAGVLGVVRHMGTDGPGASIGHVGTASRRSLPAGGGMVGAIGCRRRTRVGALVAPLPRRVWSGDHWRRRLVGRCSCRQTRRSRARLHLRRLRGPDGTELIDLPRAPLPPAEYAGSAEVHRHMGRRPPRPLPEGGDHPRGVPPPHLPHQGAAVLPNVPGGWIGAWHLEIGTVGDQGDTANRAVRAHPAPCRRTVEGGGGRPRSVCRTRRRAPRGGLRAAISFGVTQGARTASGDAKNG